MDDTRPTTRARAYVAWIGRHARAVVIAHVVVLAAALYVVAFHLPLYADFSYLLPQSAPAVRDLHKIEARVQTTDTVLVVIRAGTPELRAAATADLLARVRSIPRALVERVDGDDTEARTFLRAHRFLLVPLADLEDARKALARRIHDAKLEANPLYVDLDDHEAADTEADRRELDRLRGKRHQAEERLDRPSNVSRDGRTAMLQVRTAFRGTDMDRGDQLLASLSRARDQVEVAHPGVEIGLTGGVVGTLAEHDALVHGTALSSIATTVLVALVLVLYFYSARLLVLLIGTLTIATVAAFGVAAFTVGHLNAATAFLGAIIAGNGINYGILLIARYLEERRTMSAEDALAVAIHCTVRPTLVASLGASVAYGSLAATSFRGFSDFAVIGAVGMTLCWLASFTLLPALLLRFARDPRARTREHRLGGALAGVLGFRRFRILLVIVGGIAAIAVVIVVRYVGADPFEYDIRELRSEGSAALTDRYWMHVSDAAFGRGFAGRTFIAADRADQVPLIVDALRAVDRGKPEAQHVIGSIESILDVVPEHQDAKLAVLAEIRTLLDDDALDALDDKERAELAELRPPDDLTPITLAELPPSLRDALVEKDGRSGLLVSIRPGEGIDELDGRDLVRFASAVRRVELPDGETITTSGPSVIFADVIATVAKDGPIVTVIAAAGLIVMVLVVVGRNRHAFAVLAADANGALLLVAACALLGLKVNFLDFVALPITLGLGIDYGINVAHRQAETNDHDPIRLLRTSGAAVFVCSLTTMIGYGSLLVSQNLAIRGFGAASLIGEVTSVVSALVLVPALLAIRRPRA